jgi:small membrane protein
MIAQFIFSILLAGVLLYAWTEYRRSPAVALVTLLIASAGLYFVWMPDHSTWLAEMVGIGRGVDLILYTWVCISLIVLLNLHLKLRTQMELITTLAQKVALADASRPAEIVNSIVPAKSNVAAHPAAVEPQAIGLHLSERRA